MGEATDRAIERALEAHDAFERGDGGFEVTTTPFDATVTLRTAGGTIGVLVEVRLPALNAVVAGEEVPAVVREGWFETFERRLEDLDGATQSEPAAPTVGLDETGATVVVRARFEPSRPAHGAADAKAIVDYVEGTYVEGIIPGYDYRDPVAGLIERARGYARGGGPPG